MLSINGTDPKAKAGIMARGSSLSANAANAYARVNPIDANGPRLSYRTADGGTSNTAGTGNGTSPIWVRLQRVGNTFNAYRSADGNAWTLIGSTTITMGSTIFLGLATASDTAGQTVTAQYRHFSDTTAPVVTIPAAASGLTATAASPNEVDLNWTDNSNNETGFKVQRRTTSGTYQTIFTTAPAATSFADMGVDPGTVYFYQIIATNSAGDATPSNEFGVATPNSAPTHTFASNDIGNPALAGSANAIASDQYDVTGGGTDVWNAADQAQFESTQLTGDFDVQVRVAGRNLRQRHQSAARAHGPRNPRRRQQECLHADLRRRRRTVQACLPLHHRRHEHLNRHRRQQPARHEHLAATDARRQHLHRLFEHGRRELEPDRIDHDFDGADDLCWHGRHIARRNDGNGAVQGSDDRISSEHTAIMARGTKAIRKSRRLSAPNRSARADERAAWLDTTASDRLPSASANPGHEESSSRS